MSRLLLIPWLAAAVFAACKRSAQPEPRYCPQDVSGVWVNSSDAAYAYRLNDHGDVVRGKFFHRAPDGGDAPAEPGEDPMLIELHRTANALAGTMRTFRACQLYDYRAHRWLSFDGTPTTDARDLREEALAASA